MNIDTFWHKNLGRPYRLHVQDYGGSGPAIVFLHGIAASSEDWNRLIPLLTPYYRCITIDLLGFAKSPKPQWYGYTMEDHLRSIHRTIRGLGLPGGKFILAGHSLGSLLATRYARDHPRRINRLLLLSPPVYAPADSIESRAAQRRTTWFLKLYKFMRTNPHMTPENFRRLSYLLPLPRSITIDPDTWTPFFRTLEQCIEHQTIIQDIKDIRAPIDIFYGTLDTVVVGYNVQQLARLKDVSIHTLRANHSIGRAYAHAVAKALLP